MNLYINHAFHYELENLTRLFYPNEKITVIKNSDVFDESYIKAFRNDSLFVEVKCGDFCESSSARFLMMLKTSVCFVSFCTKFSANLLMLRLLGE